MLVIHSQNASTGTMTNRPSTIASRNITQIATSAGATSTCLSCPGQLRSCLWPAAVFRTTAISAPGIGDSSKIREMFLRVWQSSTFLTAILAGPLTNIRAFDPGALGLKRSSCMDLTVYGVMGWRIFLRTSKLLGGKSGPDWSLEPRLSFLFYISCEENAVWKHALFTFFSSLVCKFCVISLVWGNWKTVFFSSLFSSLWSIFCFCWITIKNCLWVEELICRISSQIC